MGVSIDTGGKGGKKSLDAELNLVPFIDLLVCCICFLLITAVWTQMARIKVNPASRGSQGKKEDQPKKMEEKIIVLVGEEGYTVVVGADRQVVPKRGRIFDTEELGKRLRLLKEARPDKNDLTVAAEDSIRYQAVITAMDVALKEHFNQIRVTDAKAAL